MDTIVRRNDVESKFYIPAEAKLILEKWMYDNRYYCYPNKAEKLELSIKTNLSVQKISNWFINSRRRVLPKILEKEGKDSGNFTISRKKKKITAAASDVEPVIEQYSETKEQPNEKDNQITRGILFDQSTQCKCMFIIINSPN